MQTQQHSLNVGLSEITKTEDQIIACFPVGSGAEGPRLLGPVITESRVLIL